MIKVEICAQSFQAGINAFEGGAHRIELCDQLPTGGLTPKISTLRELKKEITIPIFVLIRSRAGDFVYSQHEVKKMINQIRQCVDAGADGIVCGALSKKKGIDFKILNLFIQAAAGLPITFHRAIEEVTDINDSIDLLVDHGISRILYGGKSGNAFTNRYELAKINKYINGRLILLAGSGINSENVNELIKVADLTEIHASAKYDTIKSHSQNQYDSNPVEVKKLVNAIMR